jgi:chromosome partitioning protein
MARIIAIANQKGGVGKTTTAGNLGVSLATSGRRVLLLDLDHQQSLAASFHVALPDPGLAEVLTGNADIKDVIVEVERGIYLVGGADLALAERRLAEEPGAELVLRQALASLAKKFDFVLLDCAPSLGLLTVSALTAAGEVLIPAQPEYLVLRQTAEILATIDKV